MNEESRQLSTFFLGRVSVIPSSPPKMTKILTFASKNDYEKQLKRFKTRQELNNEVLIRLYKATPVVESNSFEVMLEYPQNNDIEGFLSEEDLIVLFRCIVGALGTLHEEGYAHGDIRPDAIWFSRNLGWAKLIDRLQLSQGPLQTQLSHIFNGIPIYLPPRLFMELCAQNQKIRHNSGKTDLFSLGMLVLERMAPSGAVQRLYDRENGEFQAQEFHNLIDSLVENSVNAAQRAFISLLKSHVLRMLEEDIPDYKEVINLMHENLLVGGLLAQRFGEQGPGVLVPTKATRKFYNPIDFVDPEERYLHKELVKKQLQITSEAKSSTEKPVSDQAETYSRNLRIDPNARKFFSFSNAVPKPLRPYLEGDSKVSEHDSLIPPVDQLFGTKISKLFQDAKVLLETKKLEEEKNALALNKNNETSRPRREIEDTKIFGKNSEPCKRIRSISEPLNVLSRAHSYTSDDNTYVEIPSPSIFASRNSNKRISEVTIQKEQSINPTSQLQKFFIATLKRATSSSSETSTAEAASSRNSNFSIDLMGLPQTYEAFPHMLLRSNYNSKPKVLSAIPATVDSSLKTISFQNHLFSPIDANKKHLLFSKKTKENDLENKRQSTTKNDIVTETSKPFELRPQSRLVRGWESKDPTFNSEYQETQTFIPKKSTEPSVLKRPISLPYQTASLDARKRSFEYTQVLYPVPNQKQDRYPSLSSTLRFLNLN